MHKTKTSSCITTNLHRSLQSINKTLFFSDDETEKKFHYLTPIQVLAKSLQIWSVLWLNLITCLTLKKGRKTQEAGGDWYKVETCDEWMKE